MALPEQRTPRRKCERGVYRHISSSHAAFLMERASVPVLGGLFGMFFVAEFEPQ